MKRVITYGTFDLLHQGHINLLRRARSLGDYLIVGVTSENYDQYRGKLNVKQSVLERVESVRATGLADEVIIEEYEGQKIDDITRMKIDVFTVGSDWIGRFDYLNEYCKVVYLERTKGISSTELRNQEHPLIRFGIVGTGRIANRFVTESKFVSGATINGVYNIRYNSAESFCKKHELAFFTDNYKEFLSKVDAVYIASPHETHYSYAKEALLDDKHVLCEKPMVLIEQQAKELFDIATNRDLVLMEAIKTAYCPGFQRMVSCAKSGKIGKIISVDATFTKLVSQHSRELQNSEFGGSVTELATYPLLAILRLLGYSYNDIRFASYIDNEVDLFTRIDLQYSNAIATARVGLGVKSEGSLIVSGTRGYVYIPAPWWRTEYFELCYENPTETEKDFYKFSGDGLRYEITEFINKITFGKMDEGMNKLSCEIAKIIQEYRRKSNVTIINL